MAIDITAGHYWNIYRGTVNDFDDATTVCIDEKSDQSKSYRDTDVIVGETYYYWITAVDREGNESDCYPDATAGIEVTYNNRESPFVWDAVPTTGIPAEDGGFGYVQGLTEIDDCDAIGAWTTDATVAGSIVVSADATTFKEGTGSVKIAVWRYPKSGTLYFESGTDTYECGRDVTNKYLVQSFTTAGAIDCKAIAVKVKEISTPTGLTVHIYSDNANKPNASLGSAAIISSQVILPEPKEYRYGVFGAAIALGAATRYWIVLVSADVDLGDYYSLYYQATGDGYAGEKFGYGADPTNPFFIADADLNFRVCVTGDALNKCAYTVFGAEDLTGQSYLKSWVRCTTSGAICSHIMGEADPPTISDAITINAANTWEWKSSDISDTADADKDAIITAGLKFTNIDVDRFYWIDYFVYGTNSPVLSLYRTDALESIPTQQDQFRFPSHEGSNRALAAYNVAAHADHQVKVEWADLTIVHDTEYWPIQLQWDETTALNVTIDIEAAAGAGGLDAGAEANSTWYYIHIIAKDDEGTTYAGMLSTSTNNPTMPAGYVYRALVGAVYNQADGTFREFYQRGNHVSQEEVLITDDGGDESATAISVTGACPTAITREVGGYAYTWITSGTYCQLYIYNVWASVSVGNNLIGRALSGDVSAGNWSTSLISTNIYYHMVNDGNSLADIYLTQYWMYIPI